MREKTEEQKEEERCREKARQMEKPRKINVVLEGSLNEGF